MECSGCGTKSALRVVTRVSEGGVIECCNECDNPNKYSADYRDAMGNKIVMTQEQKFSYATGTSITSKKQFSETLKKMNLVQTADHKPKYKGACKW